ncbi:MAG: DUF2993 domain-containing protein [Erysipelotrichia bacterium]|nr:DUF2993 domain-containing protein [Erysipelotrichia bacterium]
MRLSFSAIYKYSRMIILVGGFSLAGAVVMALPMGERQVAHFEKEALSCAKEVFQAHGSFHGENYIVELANHMIRGIQIRQATISFSNLNVAGLRQFTAGDFDFDQLKQNASIEVEASIDANAFQTLISREIARVSAGRRIFNNVQFVFAPGQVSVSGEIDLKKVPGNPFVFMPQQMSPFAATVSVKTEGSQILLEIYDGEMNNQPLTPELQKMLLDWLNPLWDFSALPYDAALSYLEINQGGIKARGRLF